MAPSTNGTAAESPSLALGSDAMTPCGAVREHLLRLRAEIGRPQPDDGLLRLHIDAAIDAANAAEDGIEDAFAALQQVADAAAVAAETVPSEAARREALAAELDAARESVGALLAGREVTAARHAEALAARDRVIVSMHEELAEVHAEAYAVGIERDAARAAERAAEAAAGAARHLEELLLQRDRVINEMHQDLAEAHAEALTLEGERDTAAGRVAQAERASAVAQAQLVAFEDAASLLEVELDVTQQERERYRNRLRAALEAARAGRLAELTTGWMPLTGRADRPVSRRVARTTTEQVRRKGAAAHAHALAAPASEASDELTGG